MAAWVFQTTGYEGKAERQHRNQLLSAFDAERRHQIRELLDMGKYIPQEILNEHDW